MYPLHPHALAPLTKSQHDFLLLELMMEQPINELGRIFENNGFADENIDGFHREMVSHGDRIDEDGGLCINQSSSLYLGLSLPHHMSG